MSGVKSWVIVAPKFDTVAENFPFVRVYSKTSGRVLPKGRTLTDQGAAMYPESGIISIMLCRLTQVRGAKLPHCRVNPG